MTMTGRRSIALLAVAVLALAAAASARVVELEDVNVEADFMYLSKFSFEPDTGKGNGIFDVMIRSDKPGQNFLIFDSQAVWEEVYNNKDLDCRSREQMAFEIIPIVEHDPAGSGYKLERVGTLSGSETRMDAFLALSSCSDGKLQMTEARIMLLQINSSHFSMEEQGLLALFATYFVLYLILCAVHIYGQVILSRSMPIHVLFKLFTVAMVTELVSDLFRMIHEAIYKSDGIGAPRLIGAGGYFEMLSQITLMAALLLLAQGWGITTPELLHKKTTGITVAVYGIIYHILFIFQVAKNDPGSTLMTYQTVPGALLLTTRCVVMLVFFYSLRLTIRDESMPERLFFYRAMGVAFGIWFLAMPLGVVCSLAAEWLYREKVVVALQTTIDFLAFTSVAYLLWPSRVSEYFRVAPPTVYGASAGAAAASTQKSPYGAI